MNQRHLEWLSAGPMGALLLGGCAVQEQEDENPKADVVVVEDGQDPAAGGISAKLTVESTSVTSTPP